ncbi:MAG: hypothetical protein AB7G10_19890 [Reyranellaceae bacterium]
MIDDSNETTTLSYDQLELQRTAAHNAAIGRLLAKGYTDAAGEPRKVHSRSHAEFLIRAGEIVLETEPTD